MQRLHRVRRTAAPLCLALFAGCGTVVDVLGGGTTRSTSATSKLRPEDIISDGSSMLGFGGLQRAKTIFKLDSRTLSGLVTASAGTGDDEDRAGNLFVALNWMNRDARFAAGLCADAALRLIEQAVSEARRAEVKTALGNVHGYLSRHLTAQGTAHCTSVF